MDPKTEMIHVRLSKKEKAAIRKAAKRKGQKVSAFVRICAVKDAEISNQLFGESK